MKTMIAVIFCFVLTGTVHAAGPALTPQIQDILAAQKNLTAKWAADPVLVAAVKAQNEKGPIPGMDNDAWKALKSGDPIAQAFEHGAAGEWLAAKLTSSAGLVTEIFLSAAKGEKVAFVEKTTSYIHAGTPKFDVPMTGKDWQGEPELDESSQVYAIQISTPVLDGGKPIGVLVVGLSMRNLGINK